MSAAFVFIALAVLAGCSASNKNIEKNRDPKEIYDSAITAYRHQNYEEAEKTFKTLLEDHPLSPYAQEAQLLLGDVCFDAEKYDDASSYYTNFIALHPTHPRAPYALFQKGMSYFKDILTIDRDQTATKKALFTFQDLVAAYPRSQYTDKAKELIGFLRRRLADREFYVANFYYKSSNYKGALYRLREILKEYPEVGLTDKALYYIGESYMRLGEGNLAKDAFSTLVSKFPKSPYVKDARSRLNES